MNPVYLVDDIPQKVAGYHAVDCAPENRGYHVPPIAAVGPLKVAQIGKQARYFCPVGPEKQDLHATSRKADQRLRKTSNGSENCEGGLQGSQNLLG
jgi:hypothetical protein